MEATAAATTAPVSHELVPQLRFPPGYRFVPTEEELVDVYLRAKIQGYKLPLQVINDVSILDWQPGSLVEAYKGYGENRWFFFAVREQSSSNKEKEPSRKVRVDGVTAAWKATGSVQLIRRQARSKDGDKLVVGSKRVLIYNSSDPNENGKWSMHEYILKDHAEIGQYALYSIQRKQHSDTQDNGDMDPEKKKTKKRKRTEKTTCTQLLEGVQLQLPHPETTTQFAEPPLKPTKKAKAQRKKKPSLQVGIEGEQKQGQSPSQMEPVTPPKKDELAQQEGQSPMQPQEQPAADGAPAPIVLSTTVPLQTVRVLPPSEPDGTPGTSVPTLEKYPPDEFMSQLIALLCNYNQSANNQGQEQGPPSLTGRTTCLAAPDTNVVAADHAPFQPYQQKEDSYSMFDLQNRQHLFSVENQSVYMEQGWQHVYQFLPSNTTQLMMNSSGGWEHGDDQQRQIHQQEEENNGGGAFGVVQDQQPMNPLLQGGHGHGLTPKDEQQQSSGSDDLLMSGESVQMDESPQDQYLAAVAGAQEQDEQGADGTATLQSLEHDELQWRLAWLRAPNEHMLDGPCSCMICAAGLRDYYFPRP